MQQENRRIYVLTAVNIVLGGILGYFLSSNGTDFESQAFICIAGILVAAWHIFSTKKIKSAIPVIALVFVALLASTLF